MSRPPLAEHHKIVHCVKTLFPLADAIEKRVTAARAEKIGQAILASVFRREQSPAEAELADREGRAHEPAAVLLERVW